MTVVHTKKEGEKPRSLLVVKLNWQSEDPQKGPPPLSEIGIYEYQWIYHLIIILIYHIINQM